MDGKITPPKKRGWNGWKNRYYQSSGPKDIVQMGLKKDGWMTRIWALMQPNPKSQTTHSHTGRLVRRRLRAAEIPSPSPSLPYQTRIARGTKSSGGGRRQRRRRTAKEKTRTPAMPAAWNFHFESNSWFRDTAAGGGDNNRKPPPLLETRPEILSP